MSPRLVPGSSRFATLICVALLAWLPVALVGSTAAGAQSIFDVEAARTALLDGVTTLADPTQPGRLVLWGDDAYSIANYEGMDRREPMIAAAPWGAGRVVALGDHQFLNMDAYGDVADSGRFYRNGISWLSGSADLNIKIVVSTRSPGKSWLESQGFTNVIESNDYATELGDADVLIGWLGSTVSDDELDDIRTFVMGGGGLFLADYGAGYDWWWAGEISDAPGNRLLREVGIGFADDYTGGLSPTRAVGQTTAGDVLQTFDTPEAFTAAEQEIAGTTAAKLLSVLPEGDPLLMQLDGRYRSRFASLNPSVTTPVTNALDKASLEYEAQLLLSTPPGEVTAHRQAEALYGSVGTTDRVAASVSIDTGVPRWHATGLYVAPGEVVTVHVPDTLVGHGYNIRVNAHTDNIRPRTSWERPPIVHRSFPIDTATIAVANAFGGLLFIDLGNSPADVGIIQIDVENAVEAPYFVLGEHTDAEWNETLRDRPAPFAALVSDNMILSLPAHHIEAANLAEPTRLMTWWNEVVALEDWVGAQTRTSAELANVDVQISAGAAHSGYPYQAYERHWNNMADVEYLTQRGSWGDFHELGHNHQRDWWTFSGDAEVTVNVFSNIAVEQMAEAPTSGWAWSASPMSVIEHAVSDVAPGGSYSSKPNRWSFWFQLADGFGWDAYRNVFAGYEADAVSNAAALPSTDAEKKDQWLTRFSLEVGYDLSPFMVDTWGLSVSPEALAAVSHLPDWMPVTGLPIERETVGGEPIVLDVAPSTRSMTGAPSITVPQPASGSIAANSDGTWTYDPGPGFAPIEEYAYTVHSSVGNTEDISIHVVNQGPLVETWSDAAETVAHLVATQADPTAPSMRSMTADFSTEVDFDGVQMRASLIPPTDGKYTLWLESSGPSILRFAMDAAGAGAAPVAHVSIGEQDSVQLSLKAGQEYYVDATAVGGTGADHLSVEWEGPGITRQIIPAEHLRPVVELSRPLQLCGGHAVTLDLNYGWSGSTSAANDVILGTPADDTIRGRAGDDVICGGAGRDSIKGGDGADLVFGGDDVDRIIGGDGNDELYGEGGSDRIHGDAGNDRIDAGSGADRVFGGAGHDVINGMGGQDTMYGDTGNDEISGSHQSDVMYGGSGNDTLRGMGGKDKLWGESGEDNLFGGANTDYLHGGPGIDTGSGQRGRDNPLVPGVSGCESLEVETSC